MAGFTVTCGCCGRVFQPKAERCIYDRTGRCYACSQCLDRANIKTAVFKPRGKTGTILRIVFGALFILASFSSIGDGDGTWFTCLIIGLGLLLWQFWPQVSGLLRQKRNHAEVLRLREEFQAREAEKKAREAEKRAREAERPKLCSHCGATSKGFTCEYCGMPLEG